VQRPRFSGLTYAFVWHSCHSIFDLLFQTEVAGLDNVPLQGPFILASNHASFLDPPIIGSYMPRELTYFARKTLFKGPLGNLIKNLNAIPIDRDGDSDLAAFRNVFNALKQGGALLVFPEGTRSQDGNFGEVRSGVGMIACRAQVPVLPVRVFGSYDVWSRHDRYPRLGHALAIRVGPCLQPQDYDPGKADKERYLSAAKRIFEAITKLQQPLRRAL